MLFQNAFSLVFKFTKIQIVDYLAPIDVEIIPIFRDIETKAGKWSAKMR